MKTIAYLILSIVVGMVVTSSPAQAEEKKAEGKKADSSQAAPAAAITKDRAEHLVMQKYPGAKVINTEMGTVKDASGWIVRFTRTGGNVADKVMVDAQTGKLTRL